MLQCNLSSKSHRQHPSWQAVEDEIIVPTYEKNDADEYLLGKFGLIAEARSTLANFM